MAHAHLVPEVESAVQALVAQNAADTSGRIGNFRKQILATVSNRIVKQWCESVAGATRDRLTTEDAAAAICAVYVGMALDEPSVGATYQTEVAAMLVGNLRAAVRMTRLDLPQRASPHTSGPDRGGRRQGTGRGRDVPLWDDLYMPLAAFVLLSVAGMRLVYELLGGGRPLDRPFGWAPGADSLRTALRFVLLLQEDPQRFRSTAFLGSPFARHVVRTGLARIVPFQVRACARCGRDNPQDGPAQQCISCGAELEDRMRLRLLGTGYLARCAVRFDASGAPVYCSPDRPTAPQTGQDAP